MLALLVAAQVCSGGGECVPTQPDPPPPGPPVTITYTAFIPLDHARLPPSASTYFYEGDNQANYVQGAAGYTYRTQQNISVRTGLGITAAPAPVSAISRLYQQNEFNLSSSLNCYRKDCSGCKTYPGGTTITFTGFCLVRSEPPLGEGLASNMETVTAQLVAAGHHNQHTNYVTVRLRGEPLVGVSPNWWTGGISPSIDWDVTITVTIDQATNAKSYAVSGSHDGFPAHAIDINATRAWQHDIVPNDTPIDLYAPMDVNVTAQGSF